MMMDLSSKQQQDREENFWKIRDRSMRFHQEFDKKLVMQQTRYMDASHQWISMCWPSSIPQVQKMGELLGKGVGQMTGNLINYQNTMLDQSSDSFKKSMLLGGKWFERCVYV